jgi:hypothetical protein
MGVMRIGWCSGRGLRVKINHYPAGAWLGGKPAVGSPDGPARAEFQKQRQPALNCLKYREIRDAQR